MMRDGDFWTTVMDPYSEEKTSRFSALKVALLFAGAGVLSALILTPILTVDGSTRMAFAPDAYDNIITGSIPAQRPGRAYTIRKSVLQDTPDSICIIQPNGLKTGDC
jgi:hypothetical protein